MACLVLMFAALIVEYVYGGSSLPAMSMKDGCYVASEELEVTAVEGEAVVLSFPMFESVLEVRKIAPPEATYVIGKNNGTEGGVYRGEGRVQQRDNQLWFLPAEASDSGEYVCTHRNETYCVTGTIKLHVYKSSSMNMKKLSYKISARVGTNLTLKCPYLSDFNHTDEVIEWYKGPAAPQPDREGSFLLDRGKLKIPGVRQSHAGAYTCQLKVLIDDQPYKVSRVYLVRVRGFDPVATTTVSDLSVTSDPGLISSYSTVPPPEMKPPVIVSPLNGSIVESLHGSGLELFCEVLTDCQMTDSTAVTWLVNGQSVESSYLDGRALQGGRRVTRVSEGCQIELRLVVTAVTEEDVGTELKCVTQNEAGRQEVVTQLRLEDSTSTWLVVAAVAVSCFLTVVSIFLYVLFKPKRKRKMDYFLARQNSSF